MEIPRRPILITKDVFEPLFSHSDHFLNKCERLLVRTELRDRLRMTFFKCISVYFSMLTTKHCARLIHELVI